MTWLLRGLALVLAIGALVAAFVGYRLSTQPPPGPPVAPTEMAVHAARPLPAGQVIGAADLTLKPVASRPAGSFVSPGQVIGQAPTAEVPVGEMLLRAHFQASGPLLRSVHAGERAVAIKVDEVAGLAGFAQPGDRVDVLLHLRGTQETSNVSSAQVVLSDVRLLAYGESVQAPPGEGDNAVARGAEKLAGRPRSHSSAVLAVPEAATARLMLAASSGSLRLALRPPAAAAAGSPAEPARLVRLAELAQAERPAAKPQSGRPAAAPSVLIHEGVAVRAVGVPSR
jgi:pilus assembly protein CpaB